MTDKAISDAYILAISFGLFGFHHFYLNRKCWAILYMLTLGLCGVGYIVDLIRLPNLVRTANLIRRNESLKKIKRIDDAYLLWFPFGLLGFHHYYLGNYKTGLFYTFTLGIFGFGWIVDGFFMAIYVNKANGEKNCELSGGVDLGLTIALAISPLGILGGHHFYLRRYAFGIIYVFTFGLCGVGYIVDWFRCIILYTRFGDKRKHVDDVYLLWLFFGFFGLHHFYLNRTWWGLLYMFTFGALGIGWIIDGFTISTKVENYNKALQENGKIGNNEKISTLDRLNREFESSNQAGRIRVQRKIDCRRRLDEAIREYQRQNRLQNNVDEPDYDDETTESEETERNPSVTSSSSNFQYPIGMQPTHQGGYPHVQFGYPRQNQSPRQNGRYLSHPSERIPSVTSSSSNFQYPIGMQPTHQGGYPHVQFGYPRQNQSPRQNGRYLSHPSGFDFGQEDFEIRTIGRQAQFPTFPQ